MDTDQLL